MKIDITTQIVESAILQDTVYAHMLHMDRSMRQLMDTKDEHVRASLISLGWTPPKD